MVGVWGDDGEDPDADGVGDAGDGFGMPSKSNSVITYQQMPQKSTR